MLSTNATSSIQRRRNQHRRQNSTPVAFEAPKVRPLPGNTQRQRTGMSLDLRGLNLEAMAIPEQGPFLEPSLLTPVKAESFPQDGSTVSNTNLGQTQQHTMQVAQTHSQPQPGPNYEFPQASSSQTSPTSPQTPQSSLQPQPPLSPTKPPTEQQLKELQDHIQSVYGSYGQVFVNILPTPISTPQKASRISNQEPLDMAPMPSSFNDMPELNFDPPITDMNFNFENPENELGYESSSYYTSDALSPSPTSSPRQRTVGTFLEDIQEYSPQTSFSQAPALFPSNSSASLDPLPAPVAEPMQRSMSVPDIPLDVDASIEYTGIAPEDVQRFISEQDPTTNRWTCLYPGCDKTFGRRENIRSHVQTHLGDRQYRCNGCGKCFVRQHDLKRHAKIHTGDKPYKCPCSAGFARQDALTRHRQRGMCVGGFPDAVRRQAKRGRPKKNRPEMEERVTKANKSRRRALASAASSVSAGSPSDAYSVSASSPPALPEVELVETNGLPTILSANDSFGAPLHPSNDPFSFNSHAMSFDTNSQTKTDSFDSSSPYADDDASMNLLRHLSAQSNAQTPPMSPNHHSSPPVQPDDICIDPAFAKIEKASATPSRSSLQSNPFTTPPTSPAEPPRNELDDLFNTMPNDSQCSQFDLEMKAMGEYVSFDSFTNELMDFI